MRDSSRPGHGTTDDAVGATDGAAGMARGAAGVAGGTAGTSGSAAGVAGDMAEGRAPLQGVGVLITRARSQAGVLQARLTTLGATVHALPVIRTTDPADWGPLDTALANLQRYQWLVITSANGARQVAARLAHHGYEPAALSHLRIAAVGSATQEALHRLGYRVDLVPPSFKGAALPDAMAPHLQPGDRILMARANIADPAPAAALRQMGHAVDDVIAYETVLESPDPAPILAALQAGEIHYVTFTSSSTVHGLLHALGGPTPLAGVRVACMGPETAAAAQGAGLPVHLQAAEVTIAGLVQALVADVLQAQAKEIES